MFDRAFFILLFAKIAKTFFWGRFHKTKIYTYIIDYQLFKFVTHL